MPISVEQLDIPGALLILPQRVGDSRGYFCELFNHNDLAAYGVDFRPVQENLAMSTQAHVVRGLHAQAPGSTQAKLLRASRGRIFDVIVDARFGSPAYGRWHGVELSADGGEQLYVPPGCLHGYATLESYCEVVYLVDAFYDPAAELRVRWDDPDLGIDWPVSPTVAVLSAADRTAIAWAEFQTPFRYP